MRVNGTFGGLLQCNDVQGTHVVCIFLRTEFDESKPLVQVADTVFWDVDIA